MSWNGGKWEWPGSRGAGAEPDEFSRRTAGKDALAPGPEGRRSGHGYAAMGSTNERRSTGGGGRIYRVAIRSAASIEEYVQRLDNNNDPHCPRLRTGMVGPPGYP